MATWHQQKAGLRHLYSPHPTAYKVICDPPNEFAYSILHREYNDAVALQKEIEQRTGHKPYIVNPAN